MTADNTYAASGMKATTKRREWRGWMGSFIWLYFMMYGYNNFMQNNMGYYDGSWYPFIFMALLTISIAVFGFAYGRYPDKLSKVAHYTAPVAILLTILFPLLPMAPALNLYLSETINGAIAPSTLAYMISPILMAPVITRRIYGVVYTAGSKYRLTRYMSGIAVGLAAYTLWILIPNFHQLIPFIPAMPESLTQTTVFRESAFLIPALLAVPAWLGIRDSVSAPETTAKPRSHGYLAWLIVVLLGIVILLFWMDLTHAVIHSDIGYYGDETGNRWFTLLAYAIPPVSCILFAYISDRGYERAGIMGGMAAFLICILFALMYVHNIAAEGTVLIPLAFADGFGGGYAEFFIWSFPLYFLITAKRPVFVASLGAVFWIFSAAYLWKAEIWLPEFLLKPYSPELISAALAAVAFILLAYTLFERYKEKSLAAALYALLYGKESGRELPVNEAPVTNKPTDKAVDLFTPEEREIALLLMEGRTQSEIAHKLHMPAGEMAQRIKTIREKVGGAEGPSQNMAAIIKKFNLTARETDMLTCLCKGMTNPEIAADFFISTETVKIHVRNLMNKLPVDNRSDVKEWVAAFGEAAE